VEASGVLQRKGESQRRSNLMHFDPHASDWSPMRRRRHSGVTFVTLFATYD
jgi:hypothetical protein